MNSTNQTDLERIKKPIKVLIAEDHELVRTGLSLTLKKSSQGAVEVVAEAEDGQETVDKAKESQPDVILMDIGMPVMNGITATHLIKEEMPNVRVVMLTSHQNEDEVVASLAAGADAYCLKDIKIERLIQVIEMVMDGMICLDPAIAKVVMNALPGASQEENAQSKSRKKYNTELTDREQQVLELIVKGKSNKEIVNELNITMHTVKAHVSNIIQKLAVDDRTQAAVKALQEGLVQQTRI